MQMMALRKNQLHFQTNKDPQIVIDQVRLQANAIMKSSKLKSDDNN